MPHLNSAACGAYLAEPVTSLSLSISSSSLCKLPPLSATRSSAEGESSPLPSAVELNVEKVTITTRSTATPGDVEVEESLWYLR